MIYIPTNCGISRGIWANKIWKLKLTWTICLEVWQKSLRQHGQFIFLLSTHDSNPHVNMTDSLTTWPAQTQAWRHVTAPLCSHWSLWWGRGGEGRSVWVWVEMRSDLGDVNTDWTRLARGTIRDTNQWNIPPAYRDRDNVNRSARTVLTQREKMRVMHSSATGGQ